MRLKDFLLFLLFSLAKDIWIQVSQEKVAKNVPQLRILIMNKKKIFRKGKMWKPEKLS